MGTFCYNGDLFYFDQLANQFCTWTSEEIRQIILASDIWQLRMRDPYHPRVIYGFCMHASLSEFMCHVYTFEDMIIRQCLSYDEQMAFVTQLLHAICKEQRCYPVVFETSMNRIGRTFCMSHTLALAILDRLMGIDQGHYEMYEDTYVCQGDVGPTPLHPNCTHNCSYRHPFVLINCDKFVRQA